MTIMVLVILAAIWAAVLLPPWLQNRRSSHPTASVVDFRQQLAVLQRTGDPWAAGAYAHGGRRPVPARSGMSRSEVYRRRRDVLTTLGLAAVLTLVLALFSGGSVWLLHLTVDAALLGYVALLLQVQQRKTEVAAKVRYLPAQRHGAAVPQAVLLRRQAN